MEKNRETPFIRYEESKNAGTKIIIENRYAEAEIYLLGAHLTHFQPKGEQKVIFDGKESYILPPKSAHFGIPVCWPWFGPHATDSSKPQHGFARNLPWELEEAHTLEDGSTQVTLCLESDERTLSLWDYPFKLQLIFTLGKTLRLELVTHNRSEKTMQIGQALHSYLYVQDITKITLFGLENTPFIDQLDNDRVKTEQHPLHFTRKLDRIYIPTTAACEIHDPLLKRRVVIQKSNSKATTVWNPWSENGLHDLPADTYRHFVCIEAVNTKQATQTLQPGESCSLIQTIGIESL
jgi:D-hexose-6-phosphate mutarotase